MSVVRLVSVTIMFKCMPFLCNRHVDYVNKSNSNLSSVPDEVLRYARTLEELLLDNNQIKDLPKVGMLHVLLSELELENVNKSNISLCGAMLGQQDRVKNMNKVTG